MFDKLQSRLRKDKYSKITKVISICLAASMISGCSPTAPIQKLPTSDEGLDGQITTLGLKPDLDYDKPVIEAHIEIDQLGYLPEGKKIAVFRGDNLGNEFRLVDADTMDTVYTGDIKEKSLSGAKKSKYSYGDFSDYTTPGRYYVQTDIIGYSYPFDIKENIYDDLMKEAMRQFYLNRCGTSLTHQYAGDNERNACHNDVVPLQSDIDVVLDVTGGWHIDTAGNRDVIRGCNVIEALLLAYEYNTAAFTDDCGIPESGNGIPDILDELKVETDWLLKMQDQVSGAVYDSVAVVDKGQGLDNPCHISSASMPSTLSFASALGYFSYLYQGYDNAYATVCLQAADRAMKYASKFPEECDADGYFKAAAMLYRATGYYRYKQIVSEYCADKAEFNMANNMVFTGVVTYLATKQKTDSGTCNVMMKSLRSFAEGLLSSRKDALFLMGEETDEVSHQTLLSEIARLTVVNYIISSNEYETVMEKYLHYFLGCNPYNVCYAGQYGSVNIVDGDSTKDILRQPEQDAYLILLLSGVKLR